MRLLLVEDDRALRAVLHKRLSEEGYAVDTCDNGADGYDYASALAYDAIILDVMLPGMDGFEVLRRLREERNTAGVLLLTARNAVGDRVTGLDLGADDYLTKPFAFEELLARLRVLLRRQAPVPHGAVLQYAGLQLDLSSHQVTRDGQPIRLTAKEYALLEYMMHNAEQVLTRDQIADHVWNYEYSFETNLVDVYIRYLRNKIDKDSGAPLLHTVRGVGYVLRKESCP